MRLPKVASVEGLFILVFGIFHFAIPFILPPNFTANTIGFSPFSFLHIADFVLPGTFTLGILSIIFLLTKNRYPAVLLAFLYFGGVTFHALYFLGVFPPVIIVPNSIFLIAGIALDLFSVIAIYDYYRRTSNASIK